MGVRRADTCSGRRRWSYFWFSPRDSRNFVKPFTIKSDPKADPKADPLEELAKR